MSKGSRSNTNRTQNTDYSYWTDSSTDNSVQSSIDNSWADSSVTDISAVDHSVTTTTTEVNNNTDYYSTTNITTLDGGAIDGMESVANNSVSQMRMALAAASNDMFSAAEASLNNMMASSVQSVKSAENLALNYLAQTNAANHKNITTIANELGDAMTHTVGLVGQANASESEKTQDTIFKVVAVAAAAWAISKVA